MIAKRVAAFLSAIPDFAMAAVFLITWIAPDTLGDRMVRHLVSVMLLEFIIIHSAAFMGMMAFTDKPKKEKIQAIAGLAALYSLFAGVMAGAFGSWWPLLAFWGLALNRLLPVILGALPTAQEKQAIAAGWVGTACAYLLLVTITTIIPVPRLGITPEVVARQELDDQSDEPGLWRRRPEGAIAVGFFYFTLTGVGELLLARVATRGLRIP